MYVCVSSNACWLTKGQDVKNIWFPSVWYRLSTGEYPSSIPDISVDYQTQSALLWDSEEMI